MYKLSGHSLTRGAWFEPESQAMIVQERDSTSTITLGPDAPAISFDDWLLDDSWLEGVYVWRVKSVSEDANTNTRTVELEHVINALEDRYLQDVTVKTITGSSSATTCTAKQAVEYILSKHSAWTLGDFEYSVSNPYEFDTDSLMDALETVTDTLDDAVWEYDLNQIPFILHIRQRDAAVRCEMRGERNLVTLKKSVSRSGMYTRIYPIGKNNLKIDGNYLSKNEGTYGRIDHIETDESKTTKANLQAWAQARLNKHCEPTVSIAISGLELAHETGENLDRLTMNKICQVPLPEYGTTITERIVKKQWRDRKKEPENVTVTLANTTQDVTTIIKQSSKGGGKSAAGQAKQNYLFEANGEHLLYEVFDECGHVHGLLRMTSESLRIAFENLNDSTRSEFLLTAESLRIQFENEISSTRSQFEMTSESLRIQFENEISSTRSEFQMTSESLRIQFENEISSTRSEFEMTSESMRIHFENDLSSLRSDLQMTAESLRVSFTNEASSLRSEMQMSAASLRLEFQNADSSLRSEMQLTAESLRISFNNEASSLRSEFQLTAGSLRVEFQNADSSLRSAIQAEAGRISLVVDGYGSSAEVKRAAIILAINNGTSSAHIDADEVYIGNSKSTTVINGKCQLSDVSADYIAGKIATIPTLSGIVANFSGNITSGAALSGYQVYADSRNISNPIMGVAITGPVNNVYTLTATKADGTYNNFTFSRATTLTGAWSGGTYTVTASPQGDQAGTTIGKKGESWSGNTCTVTVGYENPISGAMVSTGCTFDIDASGRDASSGAASGRHGSSYSWDFVITRGDGTTKQLVIDCSDIYTAARTGYTLGTFTLADITLQGDADTVYKEVSSGGTNYYTAGTAATYYKGGTTGNYYTAGSGTKYDRGDSVTAREVVSSGGTVFYTAGTAGTYYDAGTAVTVYPGDGGSFTVQGTAAGDITEIGTAYWYKQHSSTETPTGTWYTQHSSQPSGTYYKRFAAGTTHKGLRNAGTTTKYARGTGYSITPIGTSHSITPIGSTSVRLGSAGTYYKGNGGAFTPQGTAVSVTARGDSVSVTPISGTAKMLASTTRYKAGTRYQSTYYTKS